MKTILIERCSRTVKLHLLNYVFVYAVIVLFSSHCNSFKTDHFSCKRSGTCACIFENEDGYDLSELNRSSHGLNATKDNITIYFHPCTDISIGNKSDLNDCYQGVSVCLYNHANQSFTNLGFSHEVTVTSDGLNGPVTFIYTHYSSNSSVSSITTIHLQCQYTVNSIEVITNGSTNKYDLQLKGSSACRRQVFVRADPPVETPSHLSTGSMLVIMFIVFSSLYFVGGALALKLLRGAEGREMIPNYDFWVSLPGLVKEGFMFTLSGCRTPQAYDRI